MTASQRELPKPSLNAITAKKLRDRTNAGYPFQFGRAIKALMHHR
jgi:hypothetical protein